MKDTEYLKREVDEAEKARVKEKHLHEHGECDLCGIIGRMIEGLCAPCREKYKLWDSK